MKHTLCFLPLLLISVGCASSQKRAFDPLPFHVALMPVDVQVPSSRTEMGDGKETKIRLSFDQGEISQALADALNGTCFAKATLLQQTSDELTDEDYLRAAHDLGADLIFRTTLEYQEDVNSELNDKFWLTLPLFLLGGPATWFVNDRSYYFDVNLEATAYDVTAAWSSAPRVLDAESRVVRIDRDSNKVHLDFLDRADGIGWYGLSVLVPSGFLAKQSNAVPDELNVQITEELCYNLVDEIHDRAGDLTRPDLVAFHPENVRVSAGPDGRYIEGHMVLQLGDVTDLGACRYRVNGGAFVEADFSQEVLDSQRKEKRYPFRIPLGGTASGTVQLEIEQEDALASTRTFTYSLPAQESP